MNILQHIADNVGDLIGTSKLARLNRTVFRPILRTEITREEYNMCDGTNLIPVPNRHETNIIKGYGSIKRRQMADSVLGQMVDNGTVFSDSRINSLVIGLQKERGSNSVCVKVMNQMSNAGKQRLDKALHRQYGF